MSLASGSITHRSPRRPALLALSACATPFTRGCRAVSDHAGAGRARPSSSSRRMPQLQGGLEFASVRQATSANEADPSLGYRPARTIPRSATLRRDGSTTASIDAREKVTTTMGFGGWGGWLWLGSDMAAPGYGRGWRRGFWRVPAGYGDPFWGGGFGGSGYPDVESYTIYDELPRHERSAVPADNQRLFEGHAQDDVRPADDLTRLVPNLVDRDVHELPRPFGARPSASPCRHVPKR